MSLAEAGHGALIAIEIDPDASQGEFTDIAEINADIQEPGLNRPESEVTPHNDTIDSYVFGRLGREPITFSINYLDGDASHQALIDHIVANKFFGIRFRGPGWTTPGAKEIIASGHVASIMATDPVREGARTAEVTLRLSKQMIVNGTTIGQAA